MNKAPVLCVAFAAATLMCSQAKADSCDAILTSGLRNISVSFSAEAAIARAYYNHSSKDLRTLSDDQLAHVEVEVFGSGRGNGGFSRSQRESDLRTWFETHKTTAESARTQYEHSNLIYQGSVQAWSECNALRAKTSVEINPVISPDNRTVAMSVRYTGFTRSGVKFYGVTAENFQCTVSIPSDRLKDGIEIIGEAIAVHCTRSAPEKVTQAGQEYERLARGTISIITAAHPFLLSFAEERTPTLPRAVEERFAELIKSLTSRVAALELGLATARKELETRIAAVDQSARQATQTLRNDYEQNAVRFEQNIKIHSNFEDAGRCLSTPTSMSVVQSFPCKADDVGRDPRRAYWRVVKP